MNLHRAISTYRGHTVPHFKIVEHRNRWFALSGVVIALSLIGLIFSGLNWSIDFEGGAQIQYTVTKAVTVPDVPAV